jgi:SAM-dependent methyltransferase
LEIPIPTYYGSEICRVNGIKYAGQVMLAVIRGRAQSMGIFFKSNYDCIDLKPNNYRSKFGFTSPHSQAVAFIPNGSRVLDLGCAGGYVGQFLKQKKDCFVAGVDVSPLNPEIKLDEFIEYDLNCGLPNINWKDFDYVLLLDVVEHLSEPEVFIKKLYGVLGEYPRIKIIASTGNIAFILIRLMLLLGQFNYGPRGILDMTHKRLFTFTTFKHLFTQQGFILKYSRGIPAPYPFAFGKNFFSRTLLGLNEASILLARSLFSYQIFFVFESLPSLQNLLSRSVEGASVRDDFKRRSNIQ